MPALVVSPFSTGGLVCSDTFDHTSLLRFIERRFGVDVPNLSAWRRSVTGDLSSALNMAAPAHDAAPKVPSLLPVDPKTAEQCAPTFVQGQVSNVPPYPVPSTQVMPAQEAGTASRPSGADPCVATEVEANTAARSSDGGAKATPNGASLPVTGGTATTVGVWGTAALAGVAGLLKLRRRVEAVSSARDEAAGS